MCSRLLRLSGVRLPSPPAGLREGRALDTLVASRHNAPMRGKHQPSWCATALLLASPALCMLPSSPDALATETESSPVVAPTAVVDDDSYTQWVTASWRWDVSNLRAYRVPSPQSHTCVTSGQHGGVWVIGMNEYAREPSSIVVACSVPAGRYLLDNAPGRICTTVSSPPLHASTPAGLRRCVKVALQHNQLVSALTLDGAPLQSPGPRVLTPEFEVRMPPHNNWLYAPGRTAAHAVVESQATMLRPLAPGPHTLVVTTRNNGTLLGSVTYLLKVQ